jgi:hypothetical protein
MSCCGGGRGATWSAPRRAGGSAPVWFESHIATAVTLFGRVTGMRYHFPGSGARVEVDGRDAATLEVVQGLERVERSA